MKGVLPADARCLRGQDKRRQCGRARLFRGQPRTLENAPHVKLHDKPNGPGSGGMSNPAVSVSLQCGRAETPLEVNVAGPDFYRRNFASVVFFDFDAESFVAVFRLGLLHVALGKLTEHGTQDELAHIDERGGGAVILERLRARADRRQLEAIGNAFLFFPVLVQAVRSKRGFLALGSCQGKTFIITVPITFDIEPDVPLLGRSNFPICRGLRNKLAERINVAAPQVCGGRATVLISHGQHTPPLVTGAIGVSNAPGQVRLIRDVINRRPRPGIGTNELTQDQPHKPSSGL